MTETTSKPAVLPGGRLPSLNQLAARMNAQTTATTSNNTNAASGGGANRPRLAAFGNLRTNSTASSTTSISTNDSVAVNPSQTRDGSPTPETKEPSDKPEPEGLTAEKLEKLNAESPPMLTVPQKKVGYKNIPSLDAIAARIHRISIDGTNKPPEPELIEDPKTPGIKVPAPEHPLQYTWTVYHDTKAKYPYTPATSQPPSAVDGPHGLGTPVEPSGTEYEANLTTIGSFSTVEEFCRYFNWLKPPSKLDRNSNYHLFKAGIKPMWEDPNNADGGKWVLTMKNNPQLLDRCWSYVAMALVGQELEETDGSSTSANPDPAKVDFGELCGAVVSLRSKVDRIQVWTRKKEDVERINAIGKKLVKLLDVGEGDNIGLEFQYNSSDHPAPNKFLSIQALPNTGFRSSFHAHNRNSSLGVSSPLSLQPAEPAQGPTSAGGGSLSGGVALGKVEGDKSAFGAFGVGGLSAWRTRK